MALPARDIALPSLPARVHYTAMLQGLPGAQHNVAAMPTTPRDKSKICAISLCRSAALHAIVLTCDGLLPALNLLLAEALLTQHTPPAAAATGRATEVMLVLFQFTEVRPTAATTKHARVRLAQ
jgi:hypothetical protein